MSKKSTTTYFRGFADLYFTYLQGQVTSLNMINLSIYLSIYLWLYSPFLDLGRFFQFLILYTFGRTPWTGDQPVPRPLPTHKTTQIQNKRTQTTVTQVGLEPTIPVFKRVKTVHALDSAATVTP
jgi:hypothetical protein